MATFDEQIKAFQRKALQNADKTMRSVSIKLFSAVIKSSPVDTGRFRANWQASNERPASGEVSGFSDPVNKVTTYINGAPFANEFTLANNLPYAYKLEFGYSDQAPQGFIRINVARFQSILDEQARINR